MTTRVSDLVPISVTAGVQPKTDRTPYSTAHYTMSDKVRFRFNVPEKIGGWISTTFDNEDEINGTVRTIYSSEINSQINTIIGSNTKLYSLVGSRMVNITPLQDDYIEIPNSLSTDYRTLGSNPITTAYGSETVTVSDTSAGQYKAGDTIYISGVPAAVGGIPAANLNGAHLIREIGTNSFTFIQATAATSTATGGGSSVVLSSGLVGVSATAHGQSDGDRTKIDQSAVYLASSTTIGSAGTGYRPQEVLTVSGGVGTAATFSVSSCKALSGTLGTSQLGVGSYVPNEVLTVSGGSGTAATFTVLTTKVVGATIKAAGTGGTAGVASVVGTTGSGTKFIASVTIGSTGTVTAVNSIIQGGSYTANPTAIGAEPVTGASLSGAQLSLVMGVDTINATPTNVGAYTSLPTFPASTTASGSGTGATISAMTFGVLSASLVSAGLYTTTPTNNASVTSSYGSGATLAITYTGSGSVGGITNAQMNNEFIVRNATTNKFYVMTSGQATSSVTAGGGASTVFYKEIHSGNKDESFGSGYGCGYYGMGLYGTALIAGRNKSYPRIWFASKYGDNIVLTAGNQGHLYLWDGSTSTAPAKIANSPEYINYAFVSNNIVVTFGAGGVSNKIFSSDQGDLTNWTASSTNQVFEYNLYGAGRLVSHVSVGGQNLIFTETQTYRLSYIGLPLVWSIEQMDDNIGIIGPMAQCVVGGIAYWMGGNNFFRWAGSVIEIIPSNTDEVSTIFRYVFKNLTQSQRSKTFCWYNKEFDEIWWHYCSVGSDEPDRVARLSVSDLVWVPDTIIRTAAERPNQALGYPRMTGSNGVLYRHEYGYDADGEPMSWSITTNLRSSGKDTSIIVGFVPDSVQEGTLSTKVDCFLQPQASTKIFTREYSVTPTTEKMPIEAGGRFWQYTISGSELGQSWMMGKWAEYVQRGPEV